VSGEGAKVIFISDRFGRRHGESPLCCQISGFENRSSAKGSMR